MQGLSSTDCFSMYHCVVDKLPLAFVFVSHNRKSSHYTAVSVSLPLAIWISGWVVSRTALHAADRDMSSTFPYRAKT